MDDYFNVYRLDQATVCGTGTLEPKQSKAAFLLDVEFCVFKTDPKPISAEVTLNAIGEAPSKVVPETQLRFNGDDSNDPYSDGYFFIMDVNPGTNIQVSIYAQGKEICRGNCKASIALNTGVDVATDDPKLPAPRLFKALNSKDVPDPANPGGTLDVNALVELMNYLYKRLMKGPEEAWNSTDGFESLRRITGGDDAAALEERWARQVAKMLVLTPYSAPSNACNFFGQPLEKGGGGPDSIIMKRPQDEVDPAYPITMACQHLCSMAAIARGFRFPVTTQYPDEVNFLIEFRRSTAEQNVKLLDSTSESFKDFQSHAAATAIMGKSNKIGPGTVFARTNDKHVAFILRTKEDRSTFQFFDTSGMDTMPNPNLEKEGIGDYAWVDNMNCGFEVYTLNKTVTGPAIDLMRKARPLGYARLMVMDGANLLFATPLLAMHGAGDNDNFSYSNYFWSLRQIPYQKSAQVIWAFYVPQRAFAGTTVRLGRAVPPADRWSGQNTLKNINSTDAVIPVMLLRNVGDKAEVLRKRTDGMNWLDPSDGAAFAHANAILMQNLDRFSGSLATDPGLPAAYSGLDSPDYFHGNWPNAKKQLNI